MSHIASKDRQKRLIELPLPVHIYKWLCNFRGFKDKHLQIEQDFAFGNNINRVAVYNHYQKPDYPKVKILMRNPNRGKAYYIYTYLNRLFDADLLRYVTLSNKLELQAQTAIKEFLDKCRIDEDDFALATAYKRWQRSNISKLPGIKPYEQN